MVSGLCSGFAEVEREIAGNNDDLFAIREVIIEIAAEIMVFSVISGCCAHLVCPCLFCLCLYLHCSTLYQKSQSLVALEIDLGAEIIRNME